jgi:carbamoylphosphate synthase small subunit
MEPESGVDTRAITRRLRSSGVMMGMITSSKTPAQAGGDKNAPRYDIDLLKPSPRKNSTVAKRGKDITSSRWTAGLSTTS